MLTHISKSLNFVNLLRKIKYEFQVSNKSHINKDKDEIYLSLKLENFLNNIFIL